jgi:hypothetical protein
MKTPYSITTHDGQKRTATSLTEAKRIARQIATWHGPTSRLYWQTWVDGTIIGDPTKGYDGTNPVVAIREVE